MVVRNKSKQFKILNMKKLILVLFPLIAAGQVGINTKNPTATLDVNGNAKIRQIPTGSSSDSILVVNNGNIKKIAVSSLMQVQNVCPTFLKSQSSGYYLLFKSNSSIQNPNNSIVIQGKNFVSAGTWIANNEYFFSYSNTTGSAININNFSVNFGNQTCNY